MAGASGRLVHALYLTHLFVITFYIKHVIPSDAMIELPWPVHYLIMTVAVFANGRDLQQVCGRPLSRLVLDKLRRRTPYPVGAHATARNPAKLDGVHLTNGRPSRRQPEKPAGMCITFRNKNPPPEAHCENAPGPRIRACSGRLPDNTSHRYAPDPAPGSSGRNPWGRNNLMWIAPIEMAGGKFTAAYGYRETRIEDRSGARQRRPQGGQRHVIRRRPEDRAGGGGPSVATSRQKHASRHESLHRCFLNLGIVI